MAQINIAGTLHNTEEIQGDALNSHVVAHADEILDTTQEKKQSEVNADVDTALADRYTKEETYSKTELDNLITTPDVQYVSVTATAQTTSVTDVLPATGAADTIYRVGSWDGSAFDAGKYSEYAWNGSAYQLLAVRSVVGEVFDISEYNASGGTLAEYDDLADALGTNGANVPEGLRKGGMSVKFVQSVDNKYVQYRLTATSFSVIESDWQGVDTESKDLLNKDFAIEDENHKAIAIFSEGHIQTKNFDSKVEKQRVTDGLNIRPVIGNFTYDFAIEDELQEKAIVLFKEGHIQTKNFDSKKVLDKLLNVEAFVLTHTNNINQTAIPCGLSKLAKIIRNENAVFTLGMIGDSWTQGVGNEPMNRITYVKFLTRLLWDKYGYAGLGWFDFGYSNSDMKCADDSCISLSKSSGDITYVTRTPSSLGIARSHAVFASGAYYTLTLVNNETPIDKAVVWFYNNAAFTYEINDSGIPVQVTADTSSGWQSVTITENITKIKITATANNTIIFGIDFSYGNKGVKVHKLGNRAATSTDFVEGNADEWIEGISKLNIDTLTELLYTNDRWIDNTAPTVVVNNINTLFSRFKDAQPLSDVVCIAPSDNYESGVHPYTTEQYAQAVYLYCASNNIPFVSFIPLFGTKNQVQNLGLFFDNLHPNFDGANLIGNFLFKELFNIKF